MGYLAPRAESLSLSFVQVVRGQNLHFFFLVYMASILTFLNVTQEELAEGISALLELVEPLATCLGDATCFDAPGFDASSASDEAIRFQKLGPVLKGLIAGELSQSFHSILAHIK